jgi:hypothetical protein
MLSWLRRRLEKAERIDAKVKALTPAFGIDARNEARRGSARPKARRRRWSGVLLRGLLRARREGVLVLSHLRQCGLLTLRILVIGAPPNFWRSELRP